MSFYRKTVRHFHEPGQLHELTFSCYKQMPLLTEEPWLELLADTLEAANREQNMQLVAFVFMPEHVHLLVAPLDKNPSIGLYLARIKQPFSRLIKAILEDSGSGLLKQLTVQERPGKMCFRFWQEGPGYDRNLFGEAAISSSIDYIHNNPIRRSLCSTPEEWKWSSARHYSEMFEYQSDKHIPTVQRLADFHRNNNNY